MRRPLLAAFLLSLAVHLWVLIWPQADLPEPPGDAERLVARFLPPPALETKPLPARPAPKPRPAVRPAAEQAQLSAPDAASSAPPATDAPPAGADGSAPEADELASASEPASSASEVAASASAPAETTPVAFVLPQQGRVFYVGSAGGVVGLQAFGESSWQHDGVTLKSRLSAGLTSADSSLDFNAVSRLSGPQILSESTDDHRMSKHSTSQIDQAGGVVHLQRGTDTRERQIKGMAVALSALPQMLATLGPEIGKAAFFVVGDFWVEDSVLIARGEERLSLPVGSIQTRHYQSRTDNGKLIDIWLAPEWKNAPARIRIQFSGYTIDLQAAQVEIDHQLIVDSPDAHPRE